jgi:hypothetical protein
MNRTGLQQGLRCVCNTIHIPIPIREMNIVSRKLELAHNVLIVCLETLKNNRKVKGIKRGGECAGGRGAIQ